MKKYISILGLFSAILLLLSLSLFFGCLNPFSNDNISITINIGAGGMSGNAASAARAGAWPPQNHGIFDQLEHRISLTGPGSPVNETIKGQSSATISLDRPGSWNVTIETYLEGLLYAKGNGSVNAKAGQPNQVPVNMSQSDIMFFIVRNAADWETARSTIDSPGKYAIIVAQDFGFDASPSDSTFVSTNIEVDIRGNHTISMVSGTGNLLRIGNGQIINIHDIKLKGHDDNNASLVYVDGGGTLNMHGSAAIHNNTNQTTDGGGVYVGIGKFNMYGGSIYNNQAYDGGGVFVYYDSSTSYTGGEFRMTGGIVYGSDAPPGLANNAIRGAALYAAGSIAEYGRINSIGLIDPIGDIIPWPRDVANNFSTDATFRVADGVLLGLP